MIPSTFQTEHFFLKKNEDDILQEASKKYFTSWDIFETVKKGGNSPENENGQENADNFPIGKISAFHNVSRDYFKHTCVLSINLDSYLKPSLTYEQAFSEILFLAKSEFFYLFKTDRIIIQSENAEVFSKNAESLSENCDSPSINCGKEKFHYDALIAALKFSGFSPAPEKLAKKSNGFWEIFATRSNFTVYPVRDNILHITDGTGAFMTLVLGENRSLLVDTGWGVSDIGNLVKTLSKNPVTVVNTHGHPDHCFGNCFFNEVLTPEMDREVYQEIDLFEEKRQIRFFSEEMCQVCKNLKRPPFKPYKAGDVFDLGGLTAVAVPLYGHTKGALGILIKEEKLLLSGDSLGNYVWLFLKESASIETARKCCEDLLKLDFDQILGAHTKLPWQKSSIKTMLRNIDLIQSPDFEFKDENHQVLLGFHTSLSFIDDEDGSSGIVILDKRFYK